MHLASGNVPVKYKELPGGFRGTDATVKEMSRVAMSKYGSRSPKIRALACNIIRQAGIREKDYVAEALAIGNWVKNNIRYVKDVYGQETLSYPEEVAFNMQAGDCDDQSILLAALLGSVGIPSRFKTMGLTPVQYSHVYLQAKPGKQWITMDPIMSEKPIGWEVPKSRRAIEKVYPVMGPGGYAPGQGVDGMNGLGYVGDPRVVSHVEQPTIPVNAGTGRPPPRSPARPNYVEMPSGLDTDTPVDHLMKFHPNANIGHEVRPGVARRTHPTPQQLNNGVVRNLPASQDPSEQEAMEGMHGVITPDMLADVPAAVQDQTVPAYMQSKVVVQAPEGVDAQFSRASMVVDPRKGDKVEYYGHHSMHEKPPIRPYTDVGGAPDMLPGMGLGMVGPGLGEEATGNETDPGAPLPAPAPAENTSRGPMLALVGVAAAVALLSWRAGRNK